MAAVRIALCGKGLNLSKDIIIAMKPEYDITHVFHSVATAQEELPKLLSGQAIAPSSGLGSDAESPKAEPISAVLVVAAFSSEEVAEMQKIQGADLISWFKSDSAFIDRDRYPEGTSPPNSYVIERCKVAMQRENLGPSLTGVVGGGLFRF